MIYPFYNGYNIDDTNIGCGRVVVGGCPGQPHYYADLCDLVAGCIPEQLTSPCVVSFLNGLSSAPSHYIVRTNSSGCLELVDPNLLFTDNDEKVKVDSNDAIPGYLMTKLSVCPVSQPFLSITAVGPSSNRKVEFCLNDSLFIKSFYDLSDTPSGITSCDDSGNYTTKYLIENPLGGVSVSCENKRFAEVYLSDTQVFIQSPNVFQFHLATQYTRGQRDNGITVDVSYNVVLPGLTGNTTAIQCPEDGLYEVWHYARLDSNAAMTSVRSTIMCSNPEKSHILDVSHSGADNGAPALHFISPTSPMPTSIVNISYPQFMSTYIYLRKGEWIYPIYRGATSLTYPYDGYFRLLGSGILPFDYGVVPSGSPAGTIGPKSGSRFGLRFIRSATPLVNNIYVM